MGGRKVRYFMAVRSFASLFYTTKSANMQNRRILADYNKMDLMIEKIWKTGKNKEFDVCVSHLGDTAVDPILSFLLL